MALVQIQESQLAKLGEQVSSARSVVSKLRDQLKSKATQSNAVGLATAAVAAAGFGYLRGKLEASTGAWNVPGTTVDWELVAVLGACGVALGGGMIHKSLKKVEGPATFAAAGVLGHYTGQLGRKVGKGGSLTNLIAGRVGYGMLPSPGDGASSISYHPTQISAPFGDPIAEALAQSGV